MKSWMAFVVERLFFLLQFLSLTTLFWGTREFSGRLPMGLRGRFETRRSNWIDAIILGWALVLIASIGSRWSCKPHVPTLVVILGIARVVDVVQATVNGHIFDSVRIAQGNTVNSMERSALIAIWNYLEVVGWFSLFYMGTGLGDAGQATRSFDALYFSTITQLTIGFGDVCPKNDAARLLAMTQGLVGTLLLAFAISRFASMLRAITAR